MTPEQIRKYEPDRRKLTASLGLEFKDFETQIIDGLTTLNSYTQFFETRITNIENAIALRCARKRFFGPVASLNVFVKLGILNPKAWEKVKDYAIKERKRVETEDNNPEARLEKYNKTRHAAVKKYRRRVAIIKQLEEAKTGKKIKGSDAYLLASLMKLEYQKEFIEAQRRNPFITRVEFYELKDKQMYDELVELLKKQGKSVKNLKL